MAMSNKMLVRAWILNFNETTGNLLVYYTIIVNLVTRLLLRMGSAYWNNIYSKVYISNKNKYFKEPGWHNYVHHRHRWNIFLKIYDKNDRKPIFDSNCLLFNDFCREASPIICIHQDSQNYRMILHCLSQINISVHFLLLLHTDFRTVVSTKRLNQ